MWNMEVDGDMASVSYFATYFCVRFHLNVSSTSLAGFYHG